MTVITDRVQGLVRERPGRRAGCAGSSQRAALAPLPARLAPKTSRRPTLDELLVGAWEGLRAAHAADCPVCGGTMLSRRGAGPAAGATGGCEDCGSVLS